MLISLDFESLTHNVCLLYIASLIIQQWTLTVLNRYKKGRCPKLRFIIQIERIEFEEQFAAQKLNIQLFSFEYIERRGREQLLPHEKPIPRYF